MIPGSLLRVIVSAEAAFVVLAVVGVFWHALALRRRNRRATAWSARARPIVAANLSGGGFDEEARAALMRMPLGFRSGLLEELGPSLRGSERQRLAEHAEDLGAAAAARRRCASRWWCRRLQGAFRLTAYGADLPRSLLDDRHPAVRAQAVEWVGDRRDAVLLARVVGILADPSPLCRHAAKDSLLRAGSAAAVPLADRLDGEDSRGLADALQVAASRPDPAYQGAALRLAAHEDPSVRAASASLLGALGGGAGTDLLTGLLADGDEGVRRSAVAALGRLGHWPAAPAAGRLLDDDSWGVRQAAAEALVGFGAPGVLLLRSRVRGGDPRAALVAQHALDLARLRDPTQAAR